MKIPSVAKSTFLSFWLDKREIHDGCWVWIKAKTPKGYGQFVIKRIWYSAHVVAYALHNNLDEINLHVLHTCDNPSCCNPGHLFLGTNLSNMQDRNNKGRQAKGVINGKSKLTEEQVINIYYKSKEGWTQRDLAKEFNTSRRNIRAILDGKTWRHILNNLPAWQGFGTVSVKQEGSN